MPSPEHLCIIPARGGSKRIPRKNIKAFLGKPIIAYSIEAALQSGCFTEVMVSTDDEEIAAVAREYGAEVPFMRSTDNANDFAGTYEVIQEVTNSYATQVNKVFTYSCCLYATAPFVTPAQLQKAKQILMNQEAEAVFSAVAYGYPIQRALVYRNGHLRMREAENLYRRSQDLEPCYHDAGLFYYYRTAAYLAQRSVFKMQAKAVVFSEHEVQDIDTVTDWELAELKYHYQHR